ncbi:MAG: hypothetical protein WCP34_10465 [Pseudomonadota bacterium]
MSGEIVMVSGATLGGIVAVPILVGAAYLLAQAWVEQRRQKAEQQRQTEVARITVWQTHCQIHHQKLACDREQIQTLQNHLAILRQVSGITPLPAATTQEIQSRGFIETTEALPTARLAELGAWLEQLPEALIHAPGFPKEGLYRQYQRLTAQAATGQPPDAEILDGLREGMERTLSEFLTHLERHQVIQRERLANTGILLNRLVTLEHLTTEASLQIATRALQSHLLAALERGVVSAGDFDFFERQTQALERHNEEQLARAAARHAMMASVSRHLADMGYRSLTQADDQTEWAVPGGERLRLSIGEDFQLAFRLVHERPLGLMGALGQDERNRVRHQEARWCHDARTLLRRLVRDGMDLRVAFEAEVPEARLPLVVVERPEDWQEEEAERPDEAIQRKAWRPDET